jgi:hypothetical protein
LHFGAEALSGGFAVTYTYVSGYGDISSSLALMNESDVGTAVDGEFVRMLAQAIGLGNPDSSTESVLAQTGPNAAFQNLTDADKETILGLYGDCP